MDSTTVGALLAVVTASTALITWIVKEFVKFFLRYMGDAIKLKDDQAERITNMFIEYLRTQSSDWINSLNEHTTLSKDTYNQSLDTNNQINGLIASHEKLVEHMIVIEGKLDTGVKLQQEMLDLQRRTMNVVTNGLS